MLFLLNHLNDLFTSDDGDPTRLYVYPMALLRNVGQFQAHGLASCFNPLLERLNRHITHHGARTILRGVYSQGYNAYTHRVRSGARFHDVQKGMMTTVFAGTHIVAGRTNLTRARELALLCEISLPFVRYHEKITGTNLDESLRVENVYHIDVSKLQDNERNGRWVICPHLHCYAI